MRTIMNIWNKNKKKRVKDRKRRKDLSKNKSTHWRMTVRKKERGEKWWKRYSLWLRWTSSGRPAAAGYWRSPCFYFYLIERMARRRLACDPVTTSKRSPAACRGSIIHTDALWGYIDPAAHISLYLFAHAVRGHDAWTVNRENLERSSQSDLHL